MKHLLLSALFTLFTSTVHADEPRPIWPAVVGITAAVALSQYHGHFCEGYPCAHGAHVVTNAAAAYWTTKYYGERAAWTAGISFAVVKELIDRQNGKAFRGGDVATRVLGTGVGIYLYREF